MAFLGERRFERCRRFDGQFSDNGSVIFGILTDEEIPQPDQYPVLPRVREWGGKGSKISGSSQPTDSEDRVVKDADLAAKLRALGLSAALLEESKRVHKILGQPAGQPIEPLSNDKK